MHKADMVLQQGELREAGPVLCAIPTSVNLLGCVMVVSAMSSKVNGGMEGAFALPTWKALHYPAMALLHMRYIALTIREPLMAILASPAGAPQFGPHLSLVLGFSTAFPRPIPAD